MDERKLKKVIIHNDGGHNTFHASLWEYYKKLKK